MFKELGGYFKKNGPGIATVCSMALTALSVIFAIQKAEEGSKAKANYIYEKENLDKKPIADQKSNDDLKLKVSYAIDLIKTYKESLICAGGAIVLTYSANRMNTKTIAGLGAALAISEDKLKKVYDKAETVFGKGGKDDLKEMTDCDIPPFDEDDVVKAKRRHRKEPVERFWESYAGVPFESNSRDVDAAIERAHQIASRNDGYLNYNKWRSLLGIPDAECGVCENWSKENPFEVSQKIVYIEGQEYIALIYSNDPSSKNYKKLY